MNQDKYTERLKTKSLPQLKSMATEVFNYFIRERDKYKGCISCGKYRTLQAGHYLSSGKHPGLRFTEFNVNGQCMPCNYFDHSNAIHYREGLIKRIGESEVKKLEDTAAYYKRNGYEWDRTVLIEIIIKYKSLIKNT